MIYIVVQLCCGSWGDLELPKTLAGFQRFAESLILSKPIPSWFLRLLDMLHEAEDSMDHNSIRIRELDHIQLQHIISETEFGLASDPAAYVRYHKCKDLPANYIAVGDSAMCVNPVFGFVLFAYKNWFVYLCILAIFQSRDYEDNVRSGIG
jgi:hypothetical protein